MCVIETKTANFQVVKTPSKIKFLANGTHSYNFYPIKMLMLQIGGSKATDCCIRMLYRQTLGLPYWIHHTVGHTNTYELLGWSDHQIG